MPDAGGRLTRLERWLALGLLLAAILTGWMYVRAGRAEASVRTAEAALAHAHDSTVAALRRADAADSTAEQLVRIAEAAKGPHAAAEARANQAATALRSARDSALAAARDASTTAQALRDQIERLVQASDSAEAAFVAERTRAQIRITALTEAIEGRPDSAGKHLPGLRETVAAKDAAIARLEAEVMAANDVAAALRKARPGIVHRAVNGVLAAGSGLACYGVAVTLTGPLGAIGAGTGCAAIAGAVLP